MAEHTSTAPNQEAIQQTLTERGFTVLTPDLWVSPALSDNADAPFGCNIARVTVVAYMRDPTDDLRELNTRGTAVFDEADPDNQGRQTLAQLSVASHLERLYPYTWQHSQKLGTCSTVTTLHLQQDIEGQSRSRKLMVPSQDRVTERTFDITGTLKFALFPNAPSVEKIFGDHDPISYLDRSQGRQIRRASGMGLRRLRHGSQAAN